MDWGGIENMRYLRPAFILFVLLSILTGVVYPSLVAVIGHIAFPRQVTGSLIKINNEIKGSTLIGQSFNAPHYFWPRPSATMDFPYNPLGSQGSNLGPMNPELTQQVGQRIQNIRQYNTHLSLVPVDLVTSSASGLDPEISPAAAYYQIDRVALARNVSNEEIRVLVEQHIKPRQFGFLGEERVNVLQLNIDMDHIYGRTKTQP